MTYGFRPENWAAFQRELRARGIAVSDVEKLEIRPQAAQGAEGIAAGIIDVTVTLRSGRVETWSQQQAEMPDRRRSPAHSPRALPRAQVREG